MIGWKVNTPCTFKVIVAEYRLAREFIPAESSYKPEAAMANFPGQKCPLPLLEGITIFPSKKHLGGVSFGAQL